LQAIVLNKEKINLLFMLQQMADEFYPMLTPQGKQVYVNVPEELILWGDADKLARVFNNILKNAIAYSDDNSVIGISAGQQDKNIVITFMNQGSPIPEHNQIHQLISKTIVLKYFPIELLVLVVFLDYTIYIQSFFYGYIYNNFLTNSQYP
jgi:signal transduction histidine kinase